jgi:hypothetical protein
VSLSSGTVARCSLHTSLRRKHFPVEIIFSAIKINCFSISHYHYFFLFTSIGASLSKSREGKRERKKNEDREKDNNKKRDLFIREKERDNKV